MTFWGWLSLLNRIALRYIQVAEYNNRYQYFVIFIAKLYSMRWIQNFNYISISKISFETQFSVLIGKEIWFHMAIAGITVPEGHQHILVLTHTAFVSTWGCFLEAKSALAKVVLTADSHQWGPHGQAVWQEGSQLRQQFLLFRWPRLGYYDSFKKMVSGPCVAQWWFNP